MKDELSDNEKDVLITLVRTIQIALKGDLVDLNRLPRLTAELACVQIRGMAHQIMRTQDHETATPKTHELLREHFDPEKLIEMDKQIWKGR